MNAEKVKTIDHRKVYPEVYGVKEGPVQILQIPFLKFISQKLVTSYNMNWVAIPEPIDEPWPAWKVVNQLKGLTKENGFKFKRMPPEIVWVHKREDEKWEVEQKIHVPDLIDVELFEEAISRLKKKLRDNMPDFELHEEPATLCAQKLHVGHYKDTLKTFEEVCEEAERQGYRVVGNRSEIYLTPSMDCYPPETWRTVVRVTIEKK